MSTEDTELEIIQIRDQLEKYIKQDADDASTALEYFRKLKRLSVTVDLLKITRIGATVNEYRKATKHEAVSNEAKRLVKHWRDLVSGSGTPSTTEDGGSKKKIKREHSQTDGNESDNSEKCEKKSSSEHRHKDKDHKRRSSKSEPHEDDSKKAKVSTKADSGASGSMTSEMDPSMSVPAPEDSSRVKCCELLEKALLTSDGPTPDNIRVAIATCCARRIEAAVFMDSESNVSARYRTRIISRVQNLKDARNPELREAVLRGDVPAEKFARMTSEEMASPELKQLRERYEKEAMDNSRMAFSGGTKSAMLKCKRCNKQSVSYNQMQTRSSDEPMTTFCYCNECGLRWKFC